jgi:hypothetical protein
MLIPEKRLLLLPQKLRSVQERVDFVAARVQKKQGHPGGIEVVDAFDVVDIHPKLLVWFVHDGGL